MNCPFYSSTMKKLLPLITLLFVLTITPVLAQNGNGSDCDPDDEWKNHGEYVSCVAHTHPGGAAVSAAAQSDIGKKFDDEDDIDDED